MDEVLHPHVISIYQTVGNSLFQQNNTRPPYLQYGTYLQYVKELFAIQSGQHLNWSSRSPDISPIQHLWDIIVSEYDQEIPQSQTADNPVAPRGRAAQPPRDTRKTNLAKQPALSSPSR